MRSILNQEQILKDMVYRDGMLFWLPRGYGRFDKQFAGKAAGCSLKSGVQMMSYRGGNVLVHHVVWVYHNGDIPQGYEIDHINNNPLDNRIENLRLATSSQNKFNTRIGKRNSSGIKGVMWNKATKSYRARIQVNKKSIHIGMFASIDDAERSVKLAREKFHGSFSNNG